MRSNRHIRACASRFRVWCGSWRFVLRGCYPRRHLSAKGKVGADHPTPKPQGWVLTVAPPPNPTQSSEWLLEPLRHAPSLTDVHGEHCPVGFVLGVGGIDVGLELVAGVCRWTVRKLCRYGVSGEGKRRRLKKGGHETSGVVSRASFLTVLREPPMRVQPHRVPLLAPLAFDVADLASPGQRCHVRERGRHGVLDPYPGLRRQRLVDRDQP